ncbi:MAG: DoxX family protein [Mariniphaga sp.]|nr:DoxX family protein [Mariniphaga sp.]
MKNIIKYVARILVGVTFIFSGFVKGIDPLGSTYKFTDYFHAMSLDWMVWSAFSLGILLAFAEFAIGVSMLFNIKVKFFAWPALLFMVFFTTLTLWIAIANPVTDCGCFGDALVISNWETFFKNIVLIILAFIIFHYRKTFETKSTIKLSNAAGIISVIIYFGFVIFSYNHLPVFDFRPYKVGVNISESMSVPADAPIETYKNTFYYKNKKTGKVKKFSEQNYPWQDTINWEYESIETKLINEGYEPPIHDFTMDTPEGDNVIDFFIHDENYVFIMVAYDLSKTSTSEISKINELALWAGDNSFSFIGLTSTAFDESNAFLSETGLPIEFFTCDEITLKTIIRSNPGLIAIKNGTIIGKWHNNDIPSPEEFSNKFLNK